MARRLYDLLRRRRSIRQFSSDPVDPELVRLAVATAHTAPSGANRQPWRFVVVSDPELKRQIRDGAEDEERAFYESRAAAAWLDALEPLGTDWQKPHLTDAPILIVVFEVRRPKPYYPLESIGIATGMLLASLHVMGLATLTHTPSPMRFLNAILARPPEEKPIMVIPVGWPASDAEVPDIAKKPLDDVLVWR
ncbi:MAG: nitroreductase family protein [Acidimicrobiales bacterium]